MEKRLAQIQWRIAVVLPHMTLDINVFREIQDVKSLKKNVMNLNLKNAISMCMNLVKNVF